MEFIKTALPFLAAFTIFICGLYLNNLQKALNDTIAEFKSFKADVLSNYIRRPEIEKIWERIDKIRDNNDAHR